MHQQHIIHVDKNKGIWTRNGPAAAEDTPPFTSSSLSVSMSDVNISCASCCWYERKKGMNFHTANTKPAGVNTDHLADHNNRITLLICKPKASRRIKLSQLPTTAHVNLNVNKFHLNAQQRMFLLPFCLHFHFHLIMDCHCGLPKQCRSWYEEHIDSWRQIQWLNRHRWRSS